MRPSEPEPRRSRAPAARADAATPIRLSAAASTIVEDARRGLLSPPRWMPPKHLYDAVGCALFERICALEEYYPTRAERALLARHADGLAAATEARELVELGSGTGEKAAVLLRALARRGGAVGYAPIDIAEPALIAAAARARRALPPASGGVRVRAFVGDFTRDLPLLPLLPHGPPRLFAFLGGTLGNFDDAEADALLAALSARLRAADALLVGFDLVKPVARLLRAYDDALGVTAAFDKNLLSVLDRALGADFDPARFAHEARWNEAEAQIEMHLRATEAHRVRLPALDATIALAEGETIRSEISRKFTRARASALLGRAGLALGAWLDDGDFALALARRG